MKKTLLPIIALLSIVMAGCAQYVKQGEVGLLVDNFNGKIIDVVEPGTSFRIPVNQHMVEFPTISQQYVMVQAEAEGQDTSVIVSTTEGKLTVDAAVDYRLLHNKDAIRSLYQKYAMDWDSIVSTRYKSKFRSAITKAFSTMPMNEALSGQGRSKAEKIALSYLQEEMVIDGIEVSDITIRDVIPPETIAESIAARAKAENELITARTAAQKKVAEAQGEAQAMLVRAKAQADANRMVSGSLTDNLVRMRYVEKLSDKITMVVPNDSFFNFGGVVPSVPKR